jgi:uroporphyrinogen decarboxylase
MIKNDRFLKALARQPVDKTPVWLMRQAGRYLPEYRKIRSQAGDFLTLCKTPELACEVTLQPLERFDLDAAIIFSDILTIPDAMHLGLYFEPGEGPKFKQPTCDAASIKKLGIPDPEDDLGYVMQAIRHTKQALAGKVPLIGFAGSPWTIGCYMVEGGPSKTFATIKGMLYTDPAILHQLLQKLADSISLYLQAQIAAGADVIMLFDTWGGILTPQAYQAFSLHYMQQILQSLPAHIPTIVFTKNGGLWLEAIANIGSNAVGLDWTIDVGDARQRIGHQVALQGNLDPAIMQATPEVITQHVEQILASYGSGNGHIFNLGHGITPNIQPENVAVLVDAVHEKSQQYHQCKQHDQAQ